MGPIWAVFGTYNLGIYGYPWDQGVIRRGPKQAQNQLILGCFDPNPYTPTRARAYNDLSKMPFY